LHDFLGLGFREHHHTTSFSIGIDTAANIERKVKAAADFPVLKIKLGADHDRDILAAVRAAAPDKPLRVDANEGWRTRGLALDRIEHLAADGRIQFVEQPMPANAAPEDLRWLKERSPLPLFADESFHTAADLASCQEAFHGVNVKLAKTAGIPGALGALKAARAAGLMTMVGCMVESSVGITAAAHLAELADYLDLDGNLLIENDPFAGVQVVRGRLSFASARPRSGLRVWRRDST
jgi:L-alanine-DL-glutamate epimerase-like enolase superfamily enzyme